MHSSFFIQDITVVMLTAAAVTLLFRRLRQPVVLGYLLAGFIIGPHTPPFSFVHDEAVIQTLASLGVILLMFSLGLHFHLKKLVKVGIPAFVTAFLEIIFMVWVGYELATYFGASEVTALFLGGILAVSSTTIIIKAFEELGLMHEKFSQLVFGILIVEDILAIALIALLSSIALTGSFQVSDVLNTLSRLGIFLTVLLVLGLICIPPLLRYVHRFKSDEMMLILLLGLCFGISFLAIKLGYSEALGAFMIGAIVAQTKKIGLVDNLIAPLRDMFSAIFFVSIGMMIDPTHLLLHWKMVLALSAIVIFGKVLTCSFGTFITGSSIKTSIRTGMSLAQIGEFSFIIAALGLELKVTGNSLFPITVMVSAITTFTTPYLIRCSDGVSEKLLRWSPAWLKDSLQLYTIWLSKVFQQPNKTESLTEVRHVLLQVLVNQVLVTAIFIAADFGAEKIELRWLNRSSWFYNLDAIFWGLALLSSMPLIIASFKKLSKLGFALADRVFAHSRSTTDKSKIVHGVIANLFMFAGFLVIGLWILLLSSAMFDHLTVTMSMGVIILTFGIMFWRAFDKFYSKAHKALHQTLMDENKI